MQRSALENPNICAGCAAIDWLEAVPPSGEARGGPAGPAASELECFLKLDEPSLVECVDAAEQAVQAMAEMAASEESLSDQNASPATPVALQTKRP